MTNVILSSDILDSSRVEFIRKFNEAFGKDDFATVLSMMAEDCEWFISGEGWMHGKEEMGSMLQPGGEDNGPALVEMNVEQVIAQGNYAASKGVMKMEDGKTYLFCDYYTFAGDGLDAKVTRLESFISEVTA